MCVCVTGMSFSCWGINNQQVQQVEQVEQAPPLQIFSLLPRNLGDTAVHIQNTQTPTDAYTSALHTLTHIHLHTHTLTITSLLSSKPHIHLYIFIRVKIRIQWKN